MKKMVIRRDKEALDATFGAFSLFDESGVEILTGFTLEPAGPDEVKSNLDRRIPEGKYNAVWSYSPRFKKKLPLLSNELVSKDRRILIHTGKYGRDTSGCVIVGSNLGKNGVFNSIKKFKELVECLKYEEFIIEIDNVGV